MKKYHFLELINHIENASLFAGLNKDDVISIRKNSKKTKDAIVLEIKITSNKKQEIIRGEIKKTEGSELDIQDELCKRIIIQILQKYFLT